MEIVRMPTVLVVEDEANVRKLVSVNLASRGYEVIEAKDGRQALAQVRDRAPALMVLDIKLPDLTGWDVLDQMVHDPAISANFPVLVMTASIMDTYIDRETYPRVVKVLVKPFSTTELLSAVKQSLQSR
jgi:CheY-like chemotaxis protein